MGQLALCAYLHHLHVDSRYQPEVRAVVIVRLDMGDGRNVQQKGDSVMNQLFGRGVDNTAAHSPEHASSSKLRLNK